jgi:branched-chain amino acid transport system substrate-binding protein
MRIRLSLPWVGGLIAVVVGVVLVVVLVGGGSDKEGTAGATGSAAEKGDIVIGRVTAKTQFFSYLDNPAVAGMDMAIKDINAKGGIEGRKIRAIDFDTKSNPTLGGTLGQEALDKGADLMAVSCDISFGGGAAAVAEQNGKVSFSVCASSLSFGPQGIGPLSFTAGMHVGDESAVAAEWAKSKGWKNAYILTNTTYAYNKQATTAFEQRWGEIGGKISGKGTYQDKDTSIATQIAELKRATPRPDVILQASILPEGASVARQLRAAGIDTPIVTNSNFDGNAWKQAVPNISDLYFTTYASMFGDDPRPKVNEFFQRVEQETGKPAVGAKVAIGYVLVQTLAKGIEKAGTTDGPALAKAIEGLHGADTLLGPVSYTPEYHIYLQRPLALMQVQKGKTSLVELWKPEKVPAIPEGKQEQ